MKRLTFLIALGAVLLVGALATYDDSTAGTPPYSSTFSWTLAHDTTSGNFPNADTIDSLSGSASSKIFLYNGLSNASYVTGQIWAQMTSFDTNNAGGLMDTAKDTGAFLVYSGFSEYPDSAWLVYKDSLYRANTYKGAVEFTIPADSGIGDFIYFKFISICADSSVADTATSLTYKATVIMKAKE